MKAMVASRKCEFRRHVSDVLKGCNHQVMSTDRSSQLISRALNEDFDLIVIDMDLSGIDGAESLAVLRRIRPKVPVVMVSEELPPHLSLQVAREGVFYHFHKPLYDRDFLEVVDAVAKQERSREI